MKIETQFIDCKPAVEKKKGMQTSQRMPKMRIKKGKKQSAMMGNFLGQLD